MEILVRKWISHEAQKQAHDCDSHGSARRPRRRSRLPAGQVLAEIAERNRVLRLQGVRGLGGGLFRPDRRSAQVIVANPTMMKAYKAGVPGNGRPFPEGSKIAKLQWSFKKSTEAPFVVDVPNAPTQAFLIEKDSKRFPKTGGWGYALFNHDTATGKMTADEAKSDCGHACHVAVKAKDYIFHPYQKR